MTGDERKNISLIIADDDPDDKILIREAFQETFKFAQLRFVENGEELIHYLSDADPTGSEDENKLWPDLILLDLNMPKKDGRETLRELKSSPKFHTIPVIIFTTSKSKADLQKSYELGANSFISKPVTYLELVEVVKVIGKYWFDTAMLCPQNQVRDEYKIG